MSKTEITFAQWDACVADGGCNAYRPDDRGWGRDSRPIINVNWEDAQAYVQWLTLKTGQRYRLPSEAEWEYAARAGTRTKYFWGDDVGRGRANCDGCGSQWDNKQTAPVNSFAANAFGLHDMHGNVWEWTEDCSHDSYSGAPTDGSARVSGSCSERVLRGGSWSGNSGRARAAFRYWYTPSERGISIGFRVARSARTF